MICCCNISSTVRQCVDLLLIYCCFFESLLTVKKVRFMILWAEVWGFEVSVSLMDQGSLDRLSFFCGSL